MIHEDSVTMKSGIIDLTFHMPVEDYLIKEALLCFHKHCLEQSGHAGGMKNEIVDKYHKAYLVRLEKWYLDLAENILDLKGQIDSGEFFVGRKPDAAMEDLRLIHRQLQESQEDDQNPSL